MEILEPIDLLKKELKVFEKAIDKCTVSNYNQVTTILNPWIEKYKDAIELLETPEPEMEEVLPPKEDCLMYKEKRCISNLKQGMWCTGTDCGLFLKKQ